MVKSAATKVEMQSLTSNVPPASKSAPRVHISRQADGCSCCECLLVLFTVILLTLTFPFSLFFSYKIALEYQRVVVMRLGRLVSGKARGPGLFMVNPMLDTCLTVDLRLHTFDVPPQSILTKDSVTIAVDAVVYWRIFNATMSVITVENADRSTFLLAQTTLRKILGTKTLAEVLSERLTIARQMQASLDVATDNWGIKVERVELKDVRLPPEMQRAMAAEAEAGQEARAKVVAAEGEHKASRALKAASDTIAQSPAAIQLRYLQTLISIASENNHTVVFPFPPKLFEKYMEAQKLSTESTRSISIAATQRTSKSMDDEFGLSV